MKNLIQTMQDWYALKRDNIICYLNYEGYTLIKRDARAIELSRQSEERRMKESLTRMRTRFDARTKQLGLLVN